MKKISRMAITVFSIFSLLGCDGSTNLKNYKIAAKAEVDDYALEQKDSFSDDNWLIVLDTVEGGKVAIGEAKNKPSVDTAVKNTKDEIDEVEKIRIIMDGAYLITDESWEEYVRNCALTFGEDENWVKDVLNGGDGGTWAQLLHSRSDLWTVIHENRMTVSYGSSTFNTFNFSQEGSLYQGSNARQAVSFHVEDQILIVEDKNTNEVVVRQTTYQYSASIEFASGEPIQLMPPQEISYNSTEIDWSFPLEHSVAGLLGAGLEIKHENAQEFSPKWVSDRIMANSFVVDLGALGLSNKDVLAIKHLGGYYIWNNQISMSTDSEYVYLNVNIDNNGNLTLL